MTWGKLLIAGGIISVSLGGCVTQKELGRLEQPGPRPANYKELVRSYVKANFFDPYSIRDAALSEPMTGKMPANGSSIFQYGGWIVCLQVNAKNRMGGYTGLTKTAYLIRDGAIISTLEGAALCDRLDLIPWTELENEGHISQRK